MADDVPALRCRPWRIAVFAAGVLASILGPLAVLFGLVLFGPAPYLLDRDAIEPRWFGTTTGPGGSEIRIIQAGDASDAQAQARQIRAPIPTSSATTLPGTFRYRRADTGRYGLILTVDELVLQVESADRDELARTIAGLPFLSENPEQNLLDRLLESPVRSAAGLVVYLVLAALFLARGASWAGTIEPAAGVTPVATEAELRRRLLGVSRRDLPFTIEEQPNGDLVAEWRVVDATWASVFSRAGLKKSLRLRLRLGADRIVRAIESERAVSWSAGLPGLLAAVSWSRPIRFFHVEAGSAHGLLYRDGEWHVDAAYQYRYSAIEVKSPVVRAIVDAGWTFRPVLTFVPPFG